MTNNELLNPSESSKKLSDNEEKLVNVFPQAFLGEAEVDQEEQAEQEELKLEAMRLAEEVAIAAQELKESLHNLATHSY